MVDLSYTPSLSFVSYNARKTETDYFCENGNEFIAIAMLK